jgi:hypothetical protein
MSAIASEQRTGAANWVALGAATSLNSTRRMETMLRHARCLKVDSVQVNKALSVQYDGRIDKERFVFTPPADDPLA